MEKEGKANIRFIISILFFLLLMAFLVFPLAVKLDDIPGNLTINNTRNINFTFTPTWNLDTETIGNCSLWTNFSGSWALMAEFNGTEETIVHNVSSNVSNASTSWINYTFSHDIGLMVWDIGCKNATGPELSWTFNGSNRTLAIDTISPNITFTANLYPGFNTSDETPTVDFVLTDVNGTGVNLTTNGDNDTLHISFYNSGDTVFLASYNISNGSLDCGSTGAGVTSATCAIDLTTLPLTNGTKNITINATDRAGWTNLTSFTFIVDQIDPALSYINLTNGSQIGDAVSVINGTGSLRQGQILYLTTNLTDNLTQVCNISFQFLNMSKNSGLGAWQVINITHVVSASGAEGPGEYYWGNASFTIPEGPNEFEGTNVSFRAVYNDTLGNSNTTNVSHLGVPLIIQSNDTYAPTLTINGTFTENGTNISNPTPLISWAVDERNPLKSINISVDGTTSASTGLDADGCNKYAFFTSTISSSDKNVEFFRNRSFTVDSNIADSGCTNLTNGPHYVRIIAVDIWGNSRTYFHNFTVQSGAIPGLAFNLTNEHAAGTWSKVAVNNSNITSLVGITLFGYDGVIDIDKIAYISSCNSTSQAVDNNTVIYPFNTTSELACGTTSGNRTLTVTINDTAGNSNTTVLQFLVDNVGPSFATVSPTRGQTFTNTQTELNFSVMDNDQAISFYGYYLDGSDVIQNTTINLSAAIGGAGVNTSDTRLVNLTPGTHTIKFTANDTLGNLGNTSEITFTQVGPITFGEMITSIENYTVKTFGTNLTNVSIRIKSDVGTYGDITAANSTDNTYEILFEFTGYEINISLTDINGSAANWDNINFTPFINQTSFVEGLQNNWTNTIINSTWFNNSLEKFISLNNSYYGVVVLPFNISGTIATAQEFWWVENEDILNSRTNISKCTSAFTATTTTPCWNYSTGGRTIIQVPHFSTVLVVNDSTKPTVALNSPDRNVSGFVPNVTVSFDAVSCKYILNITDSTKFSATTNLSSSATAGVVGSNNICTWSEIRFKNGVYNITYNVTDAAGNNNLTSSGNERTFTLSDGTAPGTVGLITSSPSTTSATVTVSANESINVTINYGTTNTTLGTFAHETDFSASQTVTIPDSGSLSASTTYYYNTTICDFNNNCATNGTLSFTTSAAAPPEEEAAAGGGGGGGGAVPVSDVADSRAQVWSTIPAGSSFSLDIDKATIAIMAVAVSGVKSELKNVELKVEALTENPVTTEAAAKVYQYLRVNKKNIADTDAGSFKISFRVTKAWLSENGLVSGDIALYRFKDGEWTELTAIVVGTDATYVNYEAETSGLSSFAIGVKSGVEEEVPEEVPEEIPEEVAPPEEVEEPIPIEAPSKAPVAWIIAIIVVIIGIALVVMYQKKKQQI